MGYAALAPPSPLSSPMHRLWSRVSYIGEANSHVWNLRRRCFDLRVAEARWRGVAWWPGALLRLAFCFLLFENKPMATRPLLVVCTLATRFPLKMQARPAMSGLKDAPSREVYGVHGAAAWGCGSHLSNEPSVPKGSVRSCAQCTGSERKDARAVLAPATMPGIARQL